MLRLSRLRVCPHRLSLGFAAGAFASFTPLIGFHFILAMGLAFVLRANVLASAVGTVVGNPVTFPLIWLATHQLGSRMLGIKSDGRSEAHVLSAEMPLVSSWQVYGPVFQDTLWPMIVGAIPLGLIGATASYALVYATLTRLRRRRTAGCGPAHDGAA